MAEAVTYADLRFAEIPLGKIQPTDERAEKDEEDGDLTYENVTGPKQPRVITAPPAPPTGLGNLRRTGFLAPSSLLFLILLLFLASNIGLTVKYIDLSDQFYQSQQMTESLTQGLQRKEQELSAEKHRMKKIREEQEETVNHLNASLSECDREAKRSADQKEELSWEIHHLNTSLLESQRREKESTKQKEAAEEHLKDTCPKDWIPFGGKCLRFTNEEGSWVKCDEYCKRVDGNLIVVQWIDVTLQDFLSTKAGDSWVGKELRWEGHQRKWKWPNQYGNDWSECFQIRHGKLTLDDCSETKKCVCEKNLVLVTVKKWYSDDYPQFNLWGTPYHCWRN